MLMRLYVYKTQFNILHRNEKKQTNVSVYHKHKILVKISSYKYFNIKLHDTLVVSRDDTLLPYIIESNKNYIVTENQGLKCIAKYLYGLVKPYQPTKITVIRNPLEAISDRDDKSFCLKLNTLLYLKKQTSRANSKNIERLKYDCCMLNVEDMQYKSKNYWI